MEACPTQFLSLKEMLDSDNPLALVLQGGGMRGVYSVAALSVLAERGYANRFTDVYGTSAGALNGAYFLSGQAAKGAEVYSEMLSGNRFINPKRLSKVVDIDYLVDEVLGKKIPLDLEKMHASKSLLHIGLFCAKSGKPAWVKAEKNEPVLEYLRATAALPILYGKEVNVKGEYYVDGGLSTTVPLQKALEDGHKNILMVLTRPLSYEVKDTKKHLQLLVQGLAVCKRHSKITRLQLKEKDEGLLHALFTLENAHSQTNYNVYAIAPSGKIASRLTSDKEILVASALMAKRDASKALGESLEENVVKEPEYSTKVHLASRHSIFKKELVFTTKGSLAFESFKEKLFQNRL